MSAVLKQAQAPVEHLGIDEEIGDQDDHSAERLLLGHLAQQAVHGGFLGRRPRLERLNDRVQMALTAAGRDAALNLVIERHQADGVLLRNSKYAKAAATVQA